MRFGVIFFATLLVAALPLCAAPPVVSNVTDVVIGSSDTTVLGTAIWRPDGRLAFQRFPQNEIWICQINPQTGALIPPNGRGTLVGTAAPFVGDNIQDLWFLNGQAGTVNGPEWGNSQQGVGLYLSIIDKNGVYQQAKYLLNSPTVVPFTQGGYQHRYSNLASQDASDVNARVGFTKQTIPPPFLTSTYPQRLYWQFDVPSETEHRIPLDIDTFNGTRWIPGEHALTTFVKDTNGVIQVAKFNTDTAALEFITTGPEAHAEAEIVFDPVTQTSKFMTAIENTNAIAVYELEAGQWIKKHTFQPNFRTDILLRQRPTVFAVKPFVVRGKLYFFYNVSFLENILGLLNPVDIYLGSADGTINQRLTNAGIFDFRANGQYYIGQPDNRVHIYYYTSKPTKYLAQYGRFHRLSFTIE